MLLQVSFAIHILGIIFWTGGLIVLSRFLRVFVSDPTCASLGDMQREKLLGASKSILNGFIFSGCALTLLTGLFQLGTLGLAYYAKQGWFHIKLTFVLVIIGITIYTAMQVGKAFRGESLSRKALGMIHGGTAGIVLIILMLTYLGRTI